MAASAAGGGEVSMLCLPPPHLGPSESSTADQEATKSTPADAKALVDAKIQEGLYKVKMLGRHSDKTEGEIKVLRKQVENMSAVMKLELRLDEYCTDLADMYVARLDYHGPTLSEAERQSLGEIHALATSAIADYEAQVGPTPGFDNTISGLNDAIPLEFPAPLASLLRPAAVNGGDTTR